MQKQPAFPLWNWVLVLLLLIPFPTLFAQMQPLGVFDHHEDIGNPKLKGSGIYNKEDQSYTLSSTSKNMWANTDQFHFAWKKIKGDFIIKATVRFIGKGTDPHRKIGIIARDKLTANSRYADACVHGESLTSLQYRASRW
jgi:TolB protein